MLFVLSQLDYLVELMASVHNVWVHLVNCPEASSELISALTAFISLALSGLCVHPCVIWRLFDSSTRSLVEYDRSQSASRCVDLPLNVLVALLQRNSKAILLLTNWDSDRQVAARQQSMLYADS